MFSYNRVLYTSTFWKNLCRLVLFLPYVPSINSSAESSGHRVLFLGRRLTTYRYCITVYKLYTWIRWFKYIISSGCSKRLSQTWWLKITKMYPLTAQEARSSKSLWLNQNQGVSRAMLPLEALGENKFFVFPSSGGCPRILWFVATSFQYLHPRSHRFYSLLLYVKSLRFSLIRTNVMVLRAHQNTGLSHLKNL